MKYTPWSFFWKAAKPYKWWYLLMIQAPIMNALCDFLYNYSIKKLIDLFTQAGTLTYSQALHPILYFVLAVVPWDLAWRLNNFAAWRSQPYVRRNTTVLSYEYLLGHSYKFFQNHLSGSLISKIKGIGDGYYKIWESLTGNLTRSISTVIVTGCALISISANIFVIVALFSLVFIPCCWIFYKRLSQLTGRCAESWHEIIGFMADGITNIFTLFAFASRNTEIKRVDSYYKTKNIPLTKSWFRLDFWSGVVTSILYWLFMIGVFISLIPLRNSGQITIGDMAFIISMMYLFCVNIWSSINAINQFIKVYSDFRAAFSILETPQEVIDKPNALPLTITKGAIHVNNLSFAYEGNKTVFSKLNLAVRGGEKVGLVGHSGAGKSTLISLLLKNFAANQGDILIDGASIYDVSSDSLRSQISLIPQDILLFHRSIGENIGYAKPTASQKEIEHAARMANIHDFIKSLPKGYKTLIGERGVKLSGGQRQRIAIARAILKNAPILILDEATSSLDSQTEQSIQQSINGMLKVNKATVIAIAHRLSTIRHMDRIVVMEDGRIVEEGHFRQLLRIKNGKFRKLWNHQVNGMLV